MADLAADTIAAIATPPGRGGVGIVRISGPSVTTVAAAVLGLLPPARHAQHARFFDAGGQVIDEGIALYFAGPASFTGEDILELQGHGGPVVLDLLLQRVLELGARLAEPGEFSRRAFLNDKLDLAQAEAIADLIDSQTRAAARSAMRSLSGEFSSQIHALVAAITDLRMYVEAAIDFPEEEIDFLADAHIADGLQRLIGQVEELLRRAHTGRLLRDGMTLVIAGLPNAGKSSLMNALTGQESAIVTATPGTTRDVLREQIEIDGLHISVFVDSLWRGNGVRDLVDGLTSTVVLLLGRFDPANKVVLDRLRDELRVRGYSAMLFDTTPAVSRDLSETVQVLARLSRFVIADLSDPRSSPHELQQFVPFVAVPTATVTRGQPSFSMAGVARLSIEATTVL